MIGEVIQRYFPDWEPPENRREWNYTCCPFHNESDPSAAVSFDRDAFKCHACDVKGDAIALIRLQEGVTYREAVTIAESLSTGSNDAVSRKPARKPGRAVYGEARTDSRDRLGTLPPWLR